MLSRELGAVDRFSADGKDWALAVEHHYNEAKGWHKGASLFVRL